jgi:CBS domain-containing protein
MAVPLVRDVMTPARFAVHDGAGPQEIIERLVKHDTAVLPVVDGSGRVVDVWCEADVLPHVVRDAPAVTRPRRTERRALTVAPETPVTAAAELMVAARVEGLPVVDPTGGLVGTLARRDVLRASLQFDPAVRNELAGPVLRRVLARRAPHVRVDAVDGVVTLSGWTERRSTAQMAVGLARAVPGVVDVVDRLEYRQDDTGHPPLG